MIEIEDVSKQFDRILALDGVSAQIEENCIFGLVGTNGAGKSTLLRIISGVLHPDHGQVRIDGYPVWENPRDGFAFWQIRHIFLRMRRRVRWGSITV